MVSAKDRLARFNTEELMVANITLTDQARETLRQVAATCPLRASLQAASTMENKGNFSAPCDAESFEVSEDNGEGRTFTCRHADGGACAGYIAAE